MFTRSTIDPNKFDFTWDPEKNKNNFIKHGIYFSSAVKIFWDRNGIFCDDSTHSTCENRYNIIGQSNSIIFVVYALKNNKTIRIISARKATINEKEIYKRKLSYN